MTLIWHSGTAGSFLLLAIVVALILGIPLILLALRVMEMVSEMRHDAASRVEEEPASEEQSAVEKQSKKDSVEWTPAKDMR